MKTAVMQNHSPLNPLQRLTDRFAQLRADLRRRFATRPNAIQATTGAERLDLRSASPHWIVGRGICMYRREDFTNVPGNKRRAALELRLPVWSPFRNTGHHCIWSGGIAMVWFWDNEKVQIGAELLDRPNAVAEGDVRVLPETVFRPTKPDGIHLQACHEGFELQRWQGEVLEDSFWFSARPGPAAITWFANRDGAVRSQAPEAETMPVAAAGPLLPDPWSGSLPPREWFAANEAALVALVLVALTAALVWQETRYWRVQYLKAATVEEFEQTQATLAPQLEARTELLDLRRQNRALARILEQPSQARLMAIVDEAIPSSEARFTQWRYQQGELQIVIEEPSPDPIAYVEAFSGVPIFQEVGAAPERSADRLRISLRVVP